MPVQAVVFDMDGVLIDSEPSWFAARVAYAHELGKEWTLADHQQMMGRSTAEWTVMMAQILDLSIAPDELAGEIRIRLLAEYERQLPVLPGALEAVRLAASKYKIGLASGSPTWAIDYILTLTGLDQVFQVVMHGDDVQHGKPAPDIYLEATRRLDVEPARALGIEDSGNGIRALKAAGMITLAVPSPSYPLKPDILALADKVLPSLESFSLELVESFP